jgi:ArsR family transcriptional regulator
MRPAEHTLLSSATIEYVAKIFKALSDPTRIRILHLLSQEACAVGHIAEELGMTQSAVSHQLGFLRHIQLVKHRREGNMLIYSCDDEHVISLLTQAISHAEHQKGANADA